MYLHDVWLVIFMTDTAAAKTSTDWKIASVWRSSFLLVNRRNVWHHFFGFGSFKNAPTDRRGGRLRPQLDHICLPVLLFALKFF